MSLKVQNVPMATIAISIRMYRKAFSVNIELFSPHEKIFLKLKKCTSLWRNFETMGILFFRMSSVFFSFFLFLFSFHFCSISTKTGFNLKSIFGGLGSTSLFETQLHTKHKNYIFAHKMAENDPQINFQTC